jgi:hypothetical protein
MHVATGFLSRQTPHLPVPFRACEFSLALQLALNYRMCRATIGGNFADWWLLAR